MNTEKKFEVYAITGYEFGAIVRSWGLKSAIATYKLKFPNDRIISIRKLPNDNPYF